MKFCSSISIKLFISIIFLTSSYSGLCQELSVKKALWGYKYLINDEKVSHEDFKTQLEANQKSSEIYCSKESNKYLGSGLSFIGGGLIGYSFGQSNRLKNSGIGSSRKGHLVLGVGALVLSTIFDNAYRKNTNRAIEMYNSENTFFPDDKTIRFSFESTENGVGIMWSF